MNSGSDETNTDRPSVTGGVSAAIVPGQVIAGKFKVISMLGSGGMGTVYRVQQIFLNKEFALKTMDHYTSSEVMIQRFELEAKAAFSLHHPNLVKVHDYGILDNGNPYLVMDFIDGITFAEHLKERGPLPVESVAPLFAQACFGLMEAHEHGVVHRDIKPANLMILNDADIHTEGSVKLVDFGIAKLVNREDGEIQALTRTGEIFGSPLYMSPEQCSSGIVDHRSDIYSLGCVLFEMLTGTPPHMGQSALRTMMLHQAGEIPTLKEATLGAKEFPEALELIVAKMLRKFPEQRYQNVGLVAQDLTMLGGNQKSLPNKKISLLAAKPDAKPTKIVSMTASKLYGLLGTTSLLSAALAGGCMYFFYHKLFERAPKAPQPQQQSLETMIVNKIGDDKNFSDALNTDVAERVSEGKATSKILEELPAIQEEDVVKENKKQHLYHFPSTSLGELCLFTPHDFGRFYSKAQGLVSVPIDLSVGMRIDGKNAASMLLAPSIFKKIPGKDFHGLILEVPNDIGQNEQFTDLSQEEVEPKIASALKNLDGWTNLKSLYLKNAPLNKDALLALNQLPKLQYLGFENCSLSEQILMKQKYLMELQYIYIKHTTMDPIPVLVQLSKSENLKSIAIDRAIPLPILHEFENCKNLDTLKIVTAYIKDRNIEAMSKMKNLRSISLVGMRLTPDQIKMLTSCPWLTSISLSKAQYSDGEAELIRASDKRIRI